MGALMPWAFCLVWSLSFGGHRNAMETSVDQPRAAASLHGQTPSPHVGQTPSATFDTKGRLWVVFEQDGGVFVTQSTDLGKSYGPAVRVNRDDGPISARGENRPKIAVDARGRVFVCYTRKLPTRWSGNLMFSRSLDDGQSFEAPRRLNDDVDVTGHAFAVMALNRQGHLYLAWLDGRDRVQARKEGRELAASSVYGTVSKDGGAHFAPNWRWVQGTCQCCRLAMAFDADQRPILMWRHIFGDNVRDHGIGRLVADGKELVWRRAHEDGWRIQGCPHQGPALLASDRQRTLAAWYTMQQAQPRLLVGAFDRDGALHDGPLVIEGHMPRHPDLAEVGGTTVLVYLDDRVDAGEVTLLRRDSHDGCRTWRAAATVRRAKGLVDQPALLTHDGKAYALWQTEAGLDLIPLGTEEPAPAH